MEVNTPYPGPQGVSVGGWWGGGGQPNPGGGGDMNLQILGGQNLCHFVIMSECVMYSSQEMLMRNSGRLLSFPRGLWMDFLMHQPALLSVPKSSGMGVRSQRQCPTYTRTNP